ncbi:MAG: hypothetical protein HUU15_09105 [Candidatus Brocadiae bacterium]|nr:hypothetical protein [Candidatus Brocadiia bacterium]
MDLSDLMDLIFTGEEELRSLGAAGGPEARALVDEAVAATQKARSEAAEAFSRMFAQAGLARRADVEALGARIDRLAETVERLAEAVASLRPGDRPVAGGTP